MRYEYRILRINEFYFPQYKDTKAWIFKGWRHFNDHQGMSISTFSLPEAQRVIDANIAHDNPDIEVINYPTEQA